MLIVNILKINQDFYAMCIQRNNKYYYESDVADKVSCRNPEYDCRFRDHGFFGFGLTLNKVYGRAVYVCTAESALRKQVPCLGELFGYMVYYL